MYSEKFSRPQPPRQPVPPRDFLPRREFLARQQRARQQRADVGTVALSAMDQLLTDMAGVPTRRGEVSATWMAAANNELELLRTLARAGSPDVLNVRASTLAVSLWRPLRWSRVGVPTVPCLLQGNGDTPLRIAAYLGHSEAVRLLLEHAGPQAEKDRERQKGMPLVDSSRTVAGRTACEWAREQGHTEVADLLEKDLIAQLGDEWPATIRRRDQAATAAAAKQREKEAAAAAKAALLARQSEISAQEAEAKRVLQAERLLEAELEPEPEMEPEADLEQMNLDSHGTEEVRSAALIAWDGSDQPKPDWAEDPDGGSGLLTARVQVIGRMRRRLESFRAAEALKSRFAQKARVIGKLKQSVQHVDANELLRVSTSNTALVTTCAYFAVYLGLTALLFVAPGAASTATVWAIVAVAAMLKKLVGPEHVPGWMWAVWLYVTLLFALPATLMANSDTLGHRAADLGGKGFLFMLWLSGWIFLWLMSVADKLASPIQYLDEKKTKVDYEAQMTSMPSALPFKIKLLTVAYEGYTYSGFSFFPALPWSEVATPEGLPPPQDIVMFGMVEFGSAVHQYTVLVGVCVVVVLAFGVQFGVWKFGKEGQKILVIEMCFDAIAFPVIKQFTGVFACTSTDQWRIDETTGLAVPICDASVVKSACMDLLPEVGCYSKSHLWQIFLIMTVFVPYFVLGLGLRSYAQSLSSAVVIDGVFAIVAFQLKVFLAIAASQFGDCLPIVVIGSVEFAVISMLILNCRRPFSNVLSLNAVRLTGLGLATVNGLYATYITMKHPKPPCGTQEQISQGAISANQSTASYADFIGLVVINAAVLSFGWMGYTRRRLLLERKKQRPRRRVAGEADTPVGSGDVENSAKELEAQDWLDTSTYVYVRAAKSVDDISNQHYSQRYSNDGQVGPPNDREQEVDYPIIRNRLKRLAQWQQPYTYGEFERRTGMIVVQKKRLGRPFKVFLTEKGQGQQTGQQIEDVTLDMILWSKHPTRSFAQRVFGAHGTEDLHVDGMNLQFCDVDAKEIGGERLLDKLKKAQALSKGPLHRRGKPRMLSHRTSIRFARMSGTESTLIERGEESFKTIETFVDAFAEQLRTGPEEASITTEQAQSLVFVGRLNEGMADQNELMHVFGEFGEVAEVNICGREGSSKLAWAVVKYLNDEAGRDAARLAIKADKRLWTSYGVSVKPFNVCASVAPDDHTLETRNKPSLGGNVAEAFDNLDILLRVPDLKLVDISDCGYTLNDFIDEAKERTADGDEYRWAISQQEIDIFCNPLASDGNVKLQAEGDEHPASPHVDANNDTEHLPPKERGLRTLILDVRVGLHRHTVEIGPCGGCHTCRKGCTGVRDVWRKQRQLTGRNVWEGVDYGDDIPIVAALLDAHAFLAPAPGKPAMTDLGVRIALLLELDEHHADERIDVSGKELGPGDAVLVGNWLQSVKRRPATASQPPSEHLANAPVRHLRPRTQSHTSFARKLSRKSDPECEVGPKSSIGEFNATALDISNNPGLLAHAASTDDEQNLQRYTATMAFEPVASIANVGYSMLSKPLARRKLILHSWRIFCNGLRVPTTLVELHLSHIGMAKEGALILNEAVEHMPSVTLLNVLANPLGTMGYLSIIGILEREGKDNNVRTVTGLRSSEQLSAPRGHLKSVDCRMLAYELTPPADSLACDPERTMFGVNLKEIDLSHVFANNHRTNNSSATRIALSKCCKRILANAVSQRKTPLHKLVIGMGQSNHIVELNVEMHELRLDNLGLKPVDLDIVTGWIRHHSTVSTHKTINALRKLSISTNSNVIGVATNRKRDMHMTHWERFCDALSISKIYELGCADIGMGSKAVSILANTFAVGTEYSKTLQRLDIRHNRIGDHGRTALAAALYVEGHTAEPTNLDSLQLSLEGDGNTLELDATETEFLAKNRNLRPADALLVGSWGRTRWRSLQTIDLSGNDTMFKQRVSDETNGGSQSESTDSDDESSIDQDDDREENINLRCFRATVLQCRNLTRVSGLLDSNDDFVLLKPDRLPSVRTSTLEQGGVAPVWAGGSGETLTFPELVGLPHKLMVEVWDEDPGDDSANDFIGGGLIDLSKFEIDPEKDWAHLRWVNIDHNGTAAGEVLLYLRWDEPALLVGGAQPADSSPSWHLRVDVIECNGLPKMDMNSANDPYVEVSVEGAKQRMLRSSTVHGGGANPRWQAGETMVFELLEHPPSVGLVVYDEDKITRNDVVGNAVIELGVDILGNAWEGTQEIEITDRHGRGRGTLTCNIQWARVPHSNFKLTSTVFAARNLASRDMLREDDVYVRASVNGCNRFTPVVANSNNPEWKATPDPDGRVRRLEWELDQEVPCIKVEAWDRDVHSNDDLIGMALVELDSSLFAARGADGAEPAWHKLTDAHGRHCGEVQLAFEWAVLQEEVVEVARADSRVMRNINAMKKAVAIHATLSHMDTSAWLRNSTGWASVCAALKLSGLQSICVAGLKLGPDGAEQLAHCLPRSATELDISRNLLQAKGKAAIGNAIANSAMQKLTIDLGTGNKITVLIRGRNNYGQRAERAARMRFMSSQPSGDTDSQENVLAFKGANLLPEDVTLLGCWTAGGAMAADLVQLSDNHDLFGEGVSRAQRQVVANDSGGGGRDVFAAAKNSVRKLQVIRGLGREKVDVRDTFEIAPPPEDAWKAWDHFCKQLNGTGVRRLDVANIKMRLVAWQTLLDSLGGLEQLIVLVLSSNPICGPKRTPDMHYSAWKTFCKYIKNSELTSLALDRVGMGPKSANELLDAVRIRIGRNATEGAGHSGQIDPDILTWDEIESIAGAAQGHRTNADPIVFTLSLRSNPGIIGELDHSGNLQAVDRLTPIKTHEGVYESEWPKVTLDTKRVPNAIKVSCPTGMGPGDRFKIITPAGDEIVVQVPVGTKVKNAEVSSTGTADGVAPSQGTGDEFWVDLKAFEMQMLSWQRFCRRLAMTRITVLDIRDIGMGPKAMDMFTEIIVHRCMFAESVEVVRIDSTGPRTFSSDALVVTSDGLSTQRKNFTLERHDSVLDFRDKDFGTADIRLLSAWLRLPRHGKPVDKLAVDTAGVSKFDANEHWKRESIELRAEDRELNLLGKNLGAADFELLAAWMSMPHVAKNLTKLKVEVLGNSRSHSTQVKPDTLGFLPDSTDPTLEDRSPPAIRDASTETPRRNTLNLDATEIEGCYQNLGLGDADLALLASWVKFIASSSGDEPRGSEGRIPMRRLDISGNPYHIDGALQLANVLEGSQLHEVILGDENPVTVPINDDLAVKLDYRSKQLKPSHAVVVCAAMSTNRNLVTVNLLRNNFGKQIDVVINTLEQRCKQLRTVSGIEPDVIATEDMAFASSVVGNYDPEDRARFIQAASGTALHLALSQKGSVIERLKKKQQPQEFVRCDFESVRQLIQQDAVDSTGLHVTCLSLHRVNPLPWPEPAKPGYKFQSGRPVDARGNLQIHKECLWKKHPPNHSMSEPPFSCVEAGCTVCAADLGYHPDKPPTVEFDLFKDEKEAGRDAAVLSVASKYDDQATSDEFDQALRPFGIPAELASVPYDAYNYDKVAGGLDTAGCWTPNRNPKLLAYDPRTGKTVRMNGHKIPFTVQEFVSQGLGSEWYQMDAGEISCSEDEYGAALDAARAAARRVEVAIEEHRRAKGAQALVGDSSRYMETMRTQNILRQAKDEDAKFKQALEEIRAARIPVTISGVVLRGNDWDEKLQHSKPGWVTEFVVSWSTDGEEWEPLTHQVGDTTLLTLFKADANPKTRVYFREAITARFVRIHPTQWDSMDAPLYHPIAMCAGLVRPATKIDKGIRPCQRWRDSNPIIEGRPLSGHEAITEPVTVRELTEQCKTARHAAWVQNQIMHSIEEQLPVKEYTMPFNTYLEDVRISALQRNDSLTGPMEKIRRKDGNLEAWETSEVSPATTPSSTRHTARGRPAVLAPLRPNDLKLLALDIRLARATVAVEKVTLCGNPITDTYFDTSDSAMSTQVTAADKSTMTDGEEASAAQTEPGSPVLSTRSASKARAQEMSCEGQFDVDVTGLREFARSMGSSNITELDVCACALGEHAMTKMGMSGMFDRGKDKQVQDAENMAATHWDVIREYSRQLQKVDPPLKTIKSGRVMIDQEWKDKIMQAEKNLDKAFADAFAAFQAVHRAKKDTVELRMLNVSRNSYLLGGARALAAVLPHTRLAGIIVGPRVPTLMRLNYRTETCDMSREDLDPADTIIFSAVLATFVGLKDVNLLGEVSPNRLGDPGAAALIRIFKSQERLCTLLNLKDGATCIDVAGRGLDTASAQVLAAELECCRTTRAVTRIDLSRNSFMQELLTNGSTVMQVGTGQSGVALCNLDNSEQPGWVRVSWDDDNATAEWLHATEVAVIPQTDAWEELCRAMMPCARRSHTGAEIPAYGVSPLVAARTGDVSDFYQLRFGARIFQLLPASIYANSPLFWRQRGIEAGDPVVACVIEAPKRDLVHMLLKHVTAAHDEAAGQLGSALETTEIHPKSLKCECSACTARARIYRHVADPDLTARSYAKTSLAYKNYHAQLEADALHVLYQKAIDVDLIKALPDYGIANPGGWMSRFDGSMVWVQYESHAPPSVVAQTSTGNARKTVREANLAYEKWAKRPYGSSGHAHLLQINTIILRSVGMGPLGLKAFSSHLSPQVHHLVLADNDLLGAQNGRWDLTGWKHFCMALEHSALQELDISGCGLNCDAVQLLATTVRQMATRARQMHTLLEEFTKKKAPGALAEITMNELLSLAVELGMKLGHRALQLLFYEMDEDGNNTISVAEFTHWVESHTLKCLTVDTTGRIDAPQKYTLSVEPQSSDFDSMSSEQQDAFRQQYGVWCHNSVQLSRQHVSSADVELLASWQSKVSVHMAKVDLSNNRVTEKESLPVQKRQDEPVRSHLDSMKALEQDRKQLVELKDSLRKDALDLSVVPKSRTAEDVASVNEKLQTIQMKQLQKEELEHVERPRQATPRSSRESLATLATCDGGAALISSDNIQDTPTNPDIISEKEVNKPALGAARKAKLTEKLRHQFTLTKRMAGDSAIADVLDLHRQRAKQEAQNDGSNGLAYLGAWLDGDGGVEQQQVTQNLEASQARLASVERMVLDLEADLDRTQVELDALDDESEPLQEKLARDASELNTLQKEKAGLNTHILHLEHQLHRIKSGKAYVELNLSGCSLHGSAVSNLLDGLTVSLISLDISANEFTSQSKLKIAQSLASLQDEERHLDSGGKLEVGTLVIDLGEDQQSTTLSAEQGGTVAHGPAVLRVADRSISVRRWGLAPADQILLGSWFGMASPQACLTKLDLSGNVLTVESAQVFAKHIKSSQLREIVLGHDVPFAVHDTERKVLLTSQERDSTPKVFVSTRNIKGQTSSGSELLSAADAVVLAPIIETLPAIEVVSLRGNLDITGGTGPPQARQYGQEMAGWNALCESWTDPAVLPNLKKLDLSRCGLNNFALEKLAPVLRRTGAVAQLEELALSDNDALTGKELRTSALGSVPIENLSRDLVEDLWIRGGNIMGWKTMLNALTFSHLRGLHVDNCRLGDDAFYILAHTMKHMTELRELSIWRNRLSLKAAEYMGEALRHYSKVNARVKLQRLIFGSDPKRRPVRSGDTTESGLQTYAYSTRELDFSPPTPEEGGKREGWSSDDLNAARILGGGRLVAGMASHFPVFPYNGGDTPSADNVEYGDGLLLVYAIFTTADNGPDVRTPSHLQSLDLTCIPLNTQAKQLLGQVVEASCLRSLKLVLGSREAVFEASDEATDLDLSHSHMHSDDLFILTGWLAHNPQVNPKRIRPKVKRLALNHNSNLITHTQLGVPEPAWGAFCAVLEATDIVTVELDATRLGHPAAVQPLAEAMQMMSQVTVLSVKGNPMQPDVLTTLQSSNKGGPSHRIAFFELHWGDM